MTTTTRPAPTTSTPSRRPIGWAAAAGTLPYLALKVAWLSGGDVGASDPALLHTPSTTVLNAVTLALDLCLIALALALTHRWGRRLPALTLLLPAWIGTGLLVPVAVSVLPAVLISLGSGGPGAPDVLDPWVRPVVYGGFAWQALFLLIGFALYARDRWGDVARSGTAVARPLLGAVVGGGTVMAVLSALLHLLAGAGSGSRVGLMTESVNALLAVAGAVGAVRLARGTAHRTSAVVAAWVGSGVMFAWGLYTCALTVGVTDMSAAGNAAAGLAGLTGLLAGFALAVGGLLAIAGGRAPHPAA